MHLGGVRNCAAELQESLSPPGQFTGTTGESRRRLLWVRARQRCGVASSARGASVNCCSVRNDCGARSLQPTIGVGKLNAISWMRRTMGG